MLKIINVESFEQVLKELEYPCYLESVYKRKGEYHDHTCDFDSWSGSWGFEGGGKYFDAVFEFCSNKSLQNKRLKIHIPDEDEYVQIVLKKNGSTLDEITKYARPAKEQEIREYYREIKERTRIPKE